MVWSAQPDLTRAVRNVTEANSTGNAATPILARQARYLAGVARRAPSLHNTQPWRFPGPFEAGPPPAGMFAS